VILRNLQLDGGPDADGRREFPRLQTTVRAHYQDIGQLVMAFCRDISKGGLFLQSSRFLPLNAVVRVKLELLDDGPVIPAICRVAYLRDDAEAARVRKPAGMGLEFLDLSAERLAEIERYIAKHLHVEERAPATLAARALSILVVDDDESYRERAAAPFRARGDQVRLAADGFEALAMCLKSAPDLILADLQMPRMDGWQLLRVVRGRPSLASVPVIFLTSVSDEDERLHGYQLGVDDFVVKPYRDEELLARVERVVERQLQGRAQIRQKTLHGDLTQVALPSVLSFLELERKTGELLVIGEQTAHLWLCEGQLVRVNLNGAAAPSRTALFEVLGWRSGQFEFATQAIPSSGESRENITGLLLEHARLSDEANR
jgi:CheY-like chemotaxis protein